MKRADKALAARDALQTRIDTALDIAFNPDRAQSYVDHIRTALTTPTESKEPDEGYTSRFRENPNSVGGFHD
jgi:hypothetical protein